jgi:DNA-binding MarR family transcriptional regulator
VKLSQDPTDRRNRILKLTIKGQNLLARAFPVWENTHHEIEKLIPDGDPEQFRENLQALS